MKIADQKTADDWIALRAKLDADPHRGELWAEAFDSFYLPRIETRYLLPISYIGEKDQERGEGFAIVALFCTLIEFLQTCEKGKNFRLHPDPIKNEYGLGAGKDFFKDFIRNQRPFCTKVPADLIDSFYSDVRCGLLHEARTCNTWRIVTRTSNGTLVEKVNGEILIYRNEIVPALREYFEDYRKRLLKEPTLQTNFKIKWDGLCSP